LEIEGLSEAKPLQYSRHLSQGECDHCGTSLGKIRIQGTSEFAGKVFCCEGCETVYGLIQKSHLQQFYSLKGGTQIEPVSWLENEEIDFGSPGLRDRFLRSTEEGTEVFIQITNIHCSACVWLNEKVLSELPGILHAQINFSTGRARIVFQENLTDLATIFARIRSIGYKPQLHVPGIHKQNESQLNQTLLRIIVAGFSFGNIMLFSIGLFAGYFTGIEKDFKELFHYASWALATPAYLYSGAPFRKGFFASLKKRTLTMDFLLFTGISLAYFYSVYVTLTNRGEVYFDSVAMIYFFVLIGKYFEEKARLHAQEKINSLLGKIPEEARLVTQGVETKVPSHELKEGHQIKVYAGERIAVDALLLSDSMEFDESFLTGESKPVLKKTGDTVLAGSLPWNGSALLEATTDYHASTLASLKLRMEEALLQKPQIQVLTEKLASRFISLVFGLAVLSFAFWIWKTGDLETTLITTIAVLIVACPCALGIAVPTALVINHIVAAKKGLLLRNPRVIESLARVDSVFLDKTGTLTEGNFEMRETNLRTRELQRVFLLETEVNHPIAKSVVRSLLQQFPAKSITEKAGKKTLLAGRGVRGTIIQESGEEQECILGNAQFLAEQLRIEPKMIPERAGFLGGEGTPLYYAEGNQIQGYLLLSDALRKESLEFVREIQKSLPQVSILSGDRNEAVSLLANQLGISSWKGEMTPDAKKKEITTEQMQGRTVLMVGDGINDGLALTAADVGIAHHEAEDLSLEKADVVLVSGNLMGILHALRSSKQTQKVILQNILISFAYNSVMLPLAMMGWMLPVLCSVFMTLSSLTVLSNSLSLYWRSK